jgi:hypothetical protein
MARQREVVREEFEARDIERRGKEKKCFSKCGSGSCP